MINKQMASQSFSMGEFVWWTGVAEDRTDPEMLGRIKVRMLGYHTNELSQIPKDDLFWAYPLQGITSGAMNGIGLSPTGIVEGTHVMGFFRDGHNAQDPVIMGTIGGIPAATAQASKGFNDPNGKYPKSDFVGEPDTNRLARNAKISETIVQKKRDSIDSGVSKSLGDGSWSEPAVPYDAKYPFNHVRETESGHVEEFDDTPGKERIHRYHRSGTFEEMHPNGDKVTKVVKDNYSITMGNDFIDVKGNVSITVNGNANVLVKGNSRMETGGNFDHNVGGKYQLKIGGSMHVNAGGGIFQDGPRIDLNLPGPGISF